MLFDERDLFKGKDYEVNKYITIHHPTLDEIFEYGEKEYFQILHQLTATPSNYKVWLHDNGIDYNKISDMEFFNLLCRIYKLTPKITSIFFGKLDLTKFERLETETHDEVLYDFENKIPIDNIAYLKITEFLRKIHMIKKFVQKSVDERTKKYLIEKERRQLLRNKDKPFESYFMPLVSSLVNCKDFKYNHTTVWDLPIYVFNDSVRRIQKNINYQLVMEGVYAGTIDYEKINKEEIYWMGSLD